jgi:N-acetyl-gamma-glutamylphosphate reductase
VKSIDLAITSDPRVRQLLERHPRVATVAEGEGLLTWRQGDWTRRVFVGHTDVEQRGLIELMDNNPLVCADEASVPSPAATLALIALGPLAAASMIADTPRLIVNYPADEAEVGQFLATAGWGCGVAIHVEPVDLGSVLAATAMVEIPTPEDLDDIDALYEERFGRSFFVRRDEDSEWDPALVAGTPRAVYRLRIAPDQPNSLLTVRVLADREGKAGVAQLIHAMNVMSGFEESLGLE